MVFHKLFTFLTNAEKLPMEENTVIISLYVRKKRLV